MKSGGGSKPPPSFRCELPSPEHVLDRVKTLTGELEALQAEIYGQISEPTELLDRRTLLEQAGAAGVLNSFKFALDQLRSILWFCEGGRGTVSDENMRADRERELARANELLKALSPPGWTSAKAADSGSFFERLDRVIDNYMEGVTSPKPVRRSKA